MPAGEGEQRPSCGAVELHRALCPAFEPALERNHAQCPAERKAGDRNANIHEHHDVVVTLTHRSDRNLFRGEHELQTTTGEHEGRNGLRWRARWQDRPGRPKPEEEVCEATHDGESGEEVAP